MSKGKSLERDLGLLPIITISLGAMIGSGIFVLPGLGFKLAGPSIIIAYTLAGLIVLPSALSKAEMATAMPESGGTYLFIDRSMGPLYGTIAGIGVWFSLVFKSGFALVGLGAYLLLFVNVPSSLLVFVAVGFALVLLFVNMIGVKQTARLQALIVTLVMIALTLFILDGSTFVSQDNYHPFFKFGISGLLKATGFVFVSYAGVTKIASIAEEVENPGRNIPIAIISSILMMILVYSGVVYVIVGASPTSELQDTLTPMSLAAKQFLGTVGKVGIGIIAVLALVSMANAGIISSTRYPLAMSRDKLAPENLGKINEKFKTPINSIIFTGFVLILLIAFVPVIELAKLASAFQILVFTFINVALIAFRESNLESYQPEFNSPLYPWMQIFGIIASLLLLSQMGLIPLVGALGLIVTGTLWYFVFGKKKTEREGAALNAIRRVSKDYSLRKTKALFQSGGEGGVLVVSDGNSTNEEYQSLLNISEAIMTRRGGTLDIAKFEKVPLQIPLSSAITVGENSSFKTEIDKMTYDFKFKVDINEVVCHNIKNSITNYTRDRNLNLVIGRYESKRFRGELFGHDVDDYMRNIDADMIFVRNAKFTEINKITIIGNKGPYPPLGLLVADALGQYYNAIVQFLYVIDKEVKEEERNSMSDYHKQIGQLFSSQIEYSIFTSNDYNEICNEAGKDSDLIISNTSVHHILYDVFLGSLSDQIIRTLDCPVLLIRENEPRTHTFLRSVINKVAH